MTTIRAADVHAGDVVDDHGQRHEVTRVDLLAGWAWPVAFDDHGWAMALGNEPVDVERAT